MTLVRALVIRHRALLVFSKAQSWPTIRSSELRCPSSVLEGSMYKTVVAITMIASGLVGCTSQQLYAAGQASQRTECNRILDTEDHKKCKAQANTSFERYQQQSDQVKQSK